MKDTAGVWEIDPRPTTLESWQSLLAVARDKIRY